MSISLSLAAGRGQRGRSTERTASTMGEILCGPWGFWYDAPSVFTAPTWMCSPEALQASPRRQPVKDGTRGMFPTSMQQGPCNYPAPWAGEFSRRPPQFHAPGRPSHVTPSPAVALCRRGTSVPALATACLGDLTPGPVPCHTPLHPCCTPARKHTRGYSHCPFSTPGLTGLPVWTFPSLPASRP